jgi:hydroxyacylglutathione hydrolase
MDAAALEQKLRRGEVQLIDVRARSEWIAGHIAGSRNIPLGELAAAAGKIEDSRPVVLQCASGARSSIASSVLLANGVRDVINLPGGIDAWRDAGLAITAPE